MALPLITAYATATHAPRTPKRLYDRREELMHTLLEEYRQKNPH
jgi:deoxyhypusine synthase